MVAPFQVVTDVTDCPSPDILSVSASADVMFAAAFGKGIFRKSPDDIWSEADQGLPDGIIVNRLQFIDRSVYLCTNQGLFFYDANCWYPTEITIPCYQVVKQGVFFAAATEYGIWCKIGTHWKNIAYPNMPVYDLLLTPQYYFLGSNQGISLYDRYTDSGAEFPLGTAVTSLAVVHGRLVGVSMDGKLVQGNQKGGFTVSGFEGLSLYALKSTETGVYACSSRGLYRLQLLGSRVIMRSMLTGYPVTDMCYTGDCMYISTLNWGLKKVVL
ncbi:hypothetical protein [Paenibacillus sp. OV219]|uniref:hypothetical protein n=1 Tax=Paenibacillus sp. OV219 TaxID=1884377 RepID=UPI0008B338B4|nr:hypothetical protein [Paenibacillus sp. OV219]SEN97847.1 hypothetical protein SAMN05518847_105142 [Paenibacillus sp. OV219]